MEALCRRRGDGSEPPSTMVRLLNTRSAILDQLELLVDSCERELEIFEHHPNREKMKVKLTAMGSKIQDEKKEVRLKMAEYNDFVKEWKLKMLVEAPAPSKF